MFKFPRHLQIKLDGYDNDDPNGGAFMSAGPVPGRKLCMIASNAEGWEHVSVSILGKKDKTPTWAEMNFVKDLFWSEDDVVMQLHPRKTDYVNQHPGCLHLWRPIGQEIPTPPIDFV